MKQIKVEAVTDEQSKEIEEKEVNFLKYIASNV